jgi:hypothetical protein
VLVSNPGVSSPAITLTFTGAWEVDPTNYSSAVNAQVTQWNPIIMEQSSSHTVMGQSVPNVVANAMGAAGVNAEFQTFTTAAITGLQALLTSQRTIFVSMAYGVSYYVRFGPTPDSGGGGAGSKVYDSKLQPSTAAGPYYITTATAVPQLRPPP